MGLVADQIAISISDGSKTEPNQRSLYLQIIMVTSLCVKKFYDVIQFPGHYDLDQVRYHLSEIQNPYLQIIDQSLASSSSVLDVGCGTGFISNFFATKYPQTRVVGIDFSDSINHAIAYAQTNELYNVDFVKTDFLDYRFDQKFDLVICQGVLHHIPEFDVAVAKLKDLVHHDAELCLGLYHPWGKIAKKYFKIRYDDNILMLDQEHHVFETAYTMQEVLDHFCEFDLIGHYPPARGVWSNLSALINSQNGGLITYRFKKRRQ